MGIGGITNEKHASFSQGNYKVTGDNFHYKPPLLLSAVRDACQPHVDVIIDKVVPWSNFSISLELSLWDFSEREYQTCEMVFMVIICGSEELWPKVRSHSQGSLTQRKMTLEKGNKRPPRETDRKSIIMCSCPQTWGDPNLPVGHSDMDIKNEGLLKEALH